MNVFKCKSPLKFQTFFLGYKLSNFHFKLIYSFKNTNIQISLTLGSESNLIQNPAIKAIRNEKSYMMRDTSFYPLLIHCVHYWKFTYTLWDHYSYLSHLEIKSSLCTFFYVSLKQNVGNYLFTCMKIRQLKPWKKKGGKFWWRLLE